MSIGAGEETLPGLVRRSRFPRPVVVAVTVVGAAVAHLVELAREDRFGAISRNLLAWVADRLRQQAAVGVEAVRPLDAVAVGVLVDLQRVGSVDAFEYEGPAIQLDLAGDPRRRRPPPAGMLRASSAPPNVPASQPPAAATG